MTAITLSSSLDPDVQRVGRELIGEVLRACDPGVLVRGAVDFDLFDSPTHVLAFGKASAGMARACAQGLEDRFAGGIVLCPDAMIPESRDQRVRYFGVDHPSPTARNVEATKSLVEYARSIPSTDACIVCISGGGSAHLCSPRSGVTLEQIVQTTKALNASGATIHELNQARRSLETLKAGGLADLLAGTQRCSAVVLSDVLGDDLSTIASGPMVNPAHLVEHTIVGNHMTALDASVRFLNARGCMVGFHTGMVSGDSSEQGRILAERFMDSDKSACVIAGETTVDTAGATGIGGPCIEMAISCALALAESGDLDWVCIGLATDGIDGPTDAAGGILTGEMMTSLVNQQVARKLLADHNTLAFLDTIGGTIRTGPTGTNLNDLCLVVPRGVFLG
tara:strand:+ start:239920 stop:241101 length:1182 start_codon:yes stop_codon:yes gene_type:complete